MQGKAIRVGKRNFSTILEAAEHFGVHASTAARRLRDGWPPEEAFEIRRHARSRPAGRELETSVGTFPSVKAAAIRFGLAPDTVVARLMNGWTPDEAVGVATHSRLPRVTQTLNCDGRDFPNVGRLAAAYGKSYRLVYKRLRTGWSPEQAVGSLPPPPRFRNQVGEGRGHRFREVDLVDGVEYPAASPGQYLLARRQFP